MEYKMLKKDGTVVLRPTDEYANPGQNDWSKIHTSLIGEILDDALACDYRRPIATAKTKESEFWRKLASRLNRAKTIKEAKSIYAKATAKKGE